MHSWCARLLGWRADHLPAREGLKDEHCSAAVQANEARLGVVDLGIAVGGLRMDLGHCMKQLAHSRQIGLAAAVGEQSVMADAVELGGKTCSRNRRMNSGASSVIVLCRVLPLAR
jgi:hypothetical protein